MMAPKWPYQIVLKVEDGNDAHRIQRFGYRFEARVFNLYST